MSGRQLAETAAGYRRNRWPIITGRSGQFHRNTQQDKRLAPTTRSATVQTLIDVYTNFVIGLTYIFTTIDISTVYVLITVPHFY